MTIPRGGRSSPNGNPRPDPSNFYLVKHIICLKGARDEHGEGFASLADVLGRLALSSLDEQDQMMMDVESHPLFARALKEHDHLLVTLIPGLVTETQPIDTDAIDEDAATAEENAELSSALRQYIELTRRRRKRAEKFYSLLQPFLAEYAAAVSELEGLAAAEPLLKGTHLSEKIEALKNTVKRKFGPMVDTLQKECVNKRRRANLSDHAVNVFKAWFRQHFSNPYPTEDEKAELARQAQVSEAQVSNWFVNVRKRYWKPHAAGDAATVVAGP